ncbi:unnamed protein product, partial [Hapterophycus canaliculatus]
RDDFGGIGLDGMNLVEAMAEAMDDLRIDNHQHNNNNINHNHDRVPAPPPQGARPVDRALEGAGGVGARRAAAAAAAGGGGGDGRAAAPRVAVPGGRGGGDGAANEADKGEVVPNNPTLVETMEAAYAAMEERASRPPPPQGESMGAYSSSADGRGGLRDAGVGRIYRNTGGGGAGGGGVGTDGGRAGAEAGFSPPLTLQPAAAGPGGRLGRRESGSKPALAAERQRPGLADHPAHEEEEEEEEEEEVAPRDTFLGLEYRPPTPPRKVRIEEKSPESIEDPVARVAIPGAAAAAAAAAAAPAAAGSSWLPRPSGGERHALGPVEGQVATSRIGAERATAPAAAAEGKQQEARGKLGEERVPAAGPDDDGEDLEDLLNDDGFLDGDLDVHMAIDELLGIRGPVTMLLRNVLWLLAFHGAYLGLFAFFPFSIGASVIHAVSKYLDPHVLASLGSRAEYLALRDVVQ